MMTFGSLFAGIGGFDLGLERAGMTCSWQVEIDADCNRVLAKHYPSVPKFADVKTCGKHNLSQVDVVCGGFPCQGLSVAGMGKGLDDERSGLFYEMVRIVDELRPSILVWENVPGLFSNRSGRDFLAVLNALDGIGYSGAWTTLNARWFGVAQQRYRVFGVFACGDFGAVRAAEILSLRNRRAGYLAESSETEQVVASTLRSRSHRPGVSAPGRGGEDDQNLVFTERGEGHQTYQEAEAASPIRTSSGGGSGKANLVMGHYDGRDVASPVTSGYAKGESVNDGNDGKKGKPQNLIMAYQATGTGAFRAGAGPLSASDDNGSNQVVVSHCLRSEGADASEDGTGRGTPLVTIPIDMRQASRGETMTNNRPEGSSGGAPGTGIGEDGEPSPALAGTHTPAIFQTRIARNGRGQPSEVASALTSSEGGTRADSKPHVFGGGHSVRRLTPTECLRLQGFPDDWLDLEPKLSDSAKYRMIGNAVVTFVAKWIGRQLMRGEKS